jgi:cyanophycinase
MIAIGVEGSGGVTIVDPSDVAFSSIEPGTRGEPVSLIGVRLHVLLQGATYDLQTRTATATSLTAGDR